MAYASSTTYLLTRLQEKFSSCESKVEGQHAGLYSYNGMGYPHSTCARKSPKLGPSPPLYATVRISLDPLSKRAFCLFTPPPPPYTHTHTHYTHSQFRDYFLFLLVSEIKFH